MVARAGAARRPAHPGDQAHRRTTRRCMAFAMAGYELVHHGEGRWNGVAIAARQGLGIERSSRTSATAPVRDCERRVIGGVRRGRLRPVRRGADARSDRRTGIRFVSLYAPNGRVVGSPFYAGKLPGTSGSRAGCARRASPDDAARHRRRLQRRADRRRRLGCRKPCTAARTSRSPSGRRSGRCSTGASCDAYRSVHAETGRFTWWDYRAGNFHKNFGMRIDHLLVTPHVADRDRRRRDRPRGAQGQADPVRPRAAGARPRRAGRAVRRRLGGGRRADRGPRRRQTEVAPAR